MYKKYCTKLKILKTQQHRSLADKYNWKKRKSNLQVPLWEEHLYVVH